LIWCADVGVVSHYSPSINQVAEALHLSVRTLRRRLSEEGTSFSELCERIRVGHAQCLLRQQGMTVAAAAVQLGFGDTRSFRRAFKRWAEQLPSKMRSVADHSVIRRMGRERAPDTVYTVRDGVIQAVDIPVEGTVTYGLPNTSLSW
jgi:AraC-like DNA-binding protein